MTLESQVADLTTSTTNLLSTVNVRMAVLNSAISTSLDFANSAIANSAIASDANTKAQLALAGTSSAAAQAANYRDQAITASQVATAANENLAAMSQTLHSGNIVKMFAYDTGKDSDGGAWVEKCQDKSWFKENLGGTKWGGQAVNELAERGDNLLSYPEQFDASPIWLGGSNGSLGIFANQAVAPDGTTTADFLRDGTTGSSIGPRQFGSVDIVSGVIYAYSVYHKIGVGVRQAAIAFAGAISGAPSGSVNLVTGESPTGITTVLEKGYWKSTVIVKGTSTGKGYIYFGLAGENGAPSYTGDGTSGIYIWGAKLNQVGVLPSTYINSPELVTNGDFSNGTVGWTVSGDTAMSVAAGQITITKATTGNAIYQSFSTVIGKTYSFNFENVSGLVYSLIGNSIASAAFAAIGGTGLKQAIFVATAATTFITLSFNGGVTGSTATYDNISVKEVTIFATPYLPYSQLAGTVYQNTTDKKFYSLNATYGQTEVFRGISRKFPATSMIVAEAGRVIIYDTATVGCPMWMVFTSVLPMGIVRAGRPITSTLAINGSVYFGASDGVNGVCGLVGVSFIKDSAVKYSDTVNESGVFPLSIYSRNIAQSPLGNLGYYIISKYINDIAATVLDSAPVDPATGLKVPTIAVATAGGVSVIKDDGTVASISPAAGISGVCNTVKFTDDGRICYSLDNTGIGRYFHVDPIPLVSRTFSANDSGFLFAENYYSFGANSTANLYLLGSPTISTFVKDAFGFTSGVTRIKRNPSAPAKGMVAYINNAYNTGWQVGDQRLATMVDTVAETITGSGELVTNGTFDTDTTGWTIINPGTVSIVNNRVRFTSTGGNDVGLVQSTPLSLIAGKSYTLSLEFYLGTKPNGYINVGVSGSNLVGFTLNASGKYLFNFIARGNSDYLTIRMLNGGTVVDQYLEFDNISVKLTEPDRSVKNLGMIVNGTLTKSPVAAGANLVAYSGFSVANYLEQPYNSNLDVGTGDFSIMGWINPTTAGQSARIVSRSDKTGAGFGGNSSYQILLLAGNLYFQSTARSINTNIACPVGQASFVSIVYSAGLLKIYLNGALIYSGATSFNITGIGFPTLTIGVGYFNGSMESSFNGLISLVRLSATAPSDDQIAHVYRTELPLFQPGAQCTLDGTSSAITAMAFDDSTDLLHVGTSWGRSTFKDLLRVESEVSTIGALTSVVAGRGMVSVASATSSSLYRPSQSLRAELKRKELAATALGKQPVFFDFDAIAAQTTFSIPKGYTTKAVYSNEALKREGTTKTYTRSFDGFAETINFNIAPGAGAWVNIMCIRSN